MALFSSFFDHFFSRGLWVPLESLGAVQERGESLGFGKLPKFQPLRMGFAVRRGFRILVLLFWFYFHRGLLGFFYFWSLEALPGFANFW